MKLKQSLLAIALITSILMPTFASNKSVNLLKEVSIALKKNNPELPSFVVNETPIKNIYEVIVNGSDIFYTEKKGQYLFFGELVKKNLVERENITQNKIESLTAFTFKELKFKDAVTKKVGNGKNMVVTFEDPNCGFCKKLQSELGKLKNVTIHTFIIPILGESSLIKAKEILCSVDKNKAWEDYMTSNKSPIVSEKILASCDTSAIKRNLDFSQKHKITGTPAIYFENGKSFKGYTTSNKIIEMMNKK
ncbi:DsbC family protein [archaeon]|nr:DsbC family protein [archaeon]